MTIRTVFFDMGGTIDTYWYTPELRLAATADFQVILASHGIALNLTDQQLYVLIIAGLSRYHQWRLASLEELPASQVWRDYIFTNYQVDPRRLEEYGDELMVWLETHYYQRQMRPEIPSVLKTLKDLGYKIGLISNVNSKGQVPHNLKQYGIMDYFNPIVLSSEYKRRKPDPAIFHHAARLSNTPAGECIFIGDRIARDIIGAKRAGFKLAIQIRHNFIHGEKDDGATPDFILNDMAELLPILRAQKELENGRCVDHSTDNVRAVLFDADGILYYRENKEREYQKIFTEFGLQQREIPEDTKEHYRRMASVGMITFKEYKQKVLQAIGITDPDHLARGVQIAEEESDDVHYFEGARQTLDQLKSRNLYLGIVTDTAHPLHEKIDKLERGGLGDLWDAIIASREVGVQKPDPQIFQLALNQLGIQPHQALFVGHKASELDGAREVGLKTVAFNYDRDAKADFYIEHFSELLMLPFLN
jgi:putative hydrolase of the HAD superfamily